MNHTNEGEADETDITEPAIAPFPKPKHKQVSAQAGRYRTLKISVKLSSIVGNHPLAKDIEMALGRMHSATAVIFITALGYTGLSGAQEAPQTIIERPDPTNPDHHVFCAAVYMSMVHFIGGGQISEELLQEVSYRFSALNFTAAKQIEAIHGIDFEIANREVLAESMSTSQIYSDYYQRWAEARDTREITLNPFFSISFEKCSEINIAAQLHMAGGPLPLR